MNVRLVSGWLCKPEARAGLDSGGPHLGGAQDAQQDLSAGVDRARAYDSAGDQLRFAPGACSRS